MSKVLVVDDNQFMRKRVSKVLIGEGFEVIEAEDGDEAIEVYRSARPDAALMDIVMPTMDGLEALTGIRKLDPAANVIMLTALNQQETVVKAIQLGAKDFLVKPVVPDKLMAALRKVLR